MSTFHALNGAIIMTADATDAAAVSLSATDPVVLAAEGVALISFVGLIFLQVQQQQEEEDSNSTLARKESNDSPSKVFSSSETASTTSMRSSIDSGDISTESNSQNDDVANAMSAELNARPKDDLTKEEDDALAAFDQGDRVGLFGSLGRLTGKIRWAQAKLKTEENLRQEADAKLNQTVEEMRDLEDQYELGQNELSRTTKDLLTTRDTLGKTQKELASASASLEELQEERKSLRKLGKVAWSLSKGRVQRRIQKIRGND